MWKMNEEEDEQILQGVNKEMRRREKEEGKKERKRRFPPVVFH